MSGDSSTCPVRAPLPADFPSVHADRQGYMSWDESVLISDIIKVNVDSEDEIVQVVNWAAKAGYRVRPVGVGHGWSPLAVQRDTPDDAPAGGQKTILVSLMGDEKHQFSMKKVTVKHADPEHGGKPTATVQLGCNNHDFLAALEATKGGPAGDLGYGIVHGPAPNSISVGGMLAINGHGSAIPCPADEKVLGDPAKLNYGSLSNLVVACRAVVWDASEKAYVVKAFRRGADASIQTLLTHIGRAFLTEVTMEIIPNYNLQCVSIMDASWETLLPENASWDNPPESSMLWYIKNYGRAEMIKFPYADAPWFKYWRATGPEQPPGSLKVTDTNNYVFADDLSPLERSIFRALISAEHTKGDDALIRQILNCGPDHDALYACPHGGDLRAALAASKGTKAASSSWWKRLEKFIVEAIDDGIVDVVELIGSPKWSGGLDTIISLIMTSKIDANGGVLKNIWGPSKNSMIYVGDETLRVTANGYCVLTTEPYIGSLCRAFTVLYQGVLSRFNKQNEFPTASPIEIRVTGVDRLGDDGRAPPALSGLNVQDAFAGFTVAVWIDALSFPGQKDSFKFYTEIEKLLLASPEFNGLTARIRPEWSKGWAYTTEAGPWTNQPFMDYARNSFAHWNESMATLDQFDPCRVFTNRWMDDFFQRTDALTAPGTAVVQKGAGAPARILRSGGSLYSPDGKSFRLTLLPDGSLSLLQGVPRDPLAPPRINPDAAIWSSGPVENGVIAGLTADGQLAVFGADGSTPLWQTGAAGAVIVRVLDEGRLVALNAAGEQVWSSLQ